MRKFILITSYLFITFICNAGIVPLETAQNVALSFYSKQIVKEIPTINNNDIFIKNVFTIKSNTIAVYYIFNIGDNGYIAISAEDNTYPILAYSFESSYNTGNNAAPFDMWMNYYKSQINYAREHNIKANDFIKNKWQELITNNRTPSNPKSVSPFIKSKWNQTSFFNIKCPADTAGPGDHVVTGCVATCLAQLMYYYRFPDNGTGTYQYLDSNYGVQSYNYQATNIKWNNMLDVPTTINPWISEVMYGCGVAVDMRWGPDGSGMYNHSAAHALKAYYKYSQDVRYVFRDSTSINWDSLMIAQLDKKMPLYYAGWSVPNISGHAFVCDGYQDTTYFHFNFGWGGSSDGYFYINNLTPGGSDFNLAQELIINIFPDTSLYTYPSYCTGQKTITANEGSFADESGPLNNYHNNSDCSWLIQPAADSVTSITLSFSGLNLQSNHDYLKVYAGTTTSATVVGNYTGSTLPANLTVNSSNALLKFTSDTDTSLSGFSLNYKANVPVYCSSKFLTTATGNFTDGSKTKKYNSNSDCKWYIVPSGAGSITLHFNNFETEANKDILYIKSSSAPYNTIASYSGINFPNDVTFNVGQLMVEFVTDYENEFQGFDINYTSSGVGVDNIDADNFKIYPNPVKNEFNIEWNAINYDEMYFQLYDLQGRLLKEVSMKGKKSITITRDGLNSGIYIYKIKSSQIATGAGKLIFE